MLLSTAASDTGPATWWADEFGLFPHRPFR